MLLPLALTIFPYSLIILIPYGYPIIIGQQYLSFIMPKKKLTAAFIESVKVVKQTDYYDSHTSGLGLRVSPGGTKTFFYRYRHNGKNRRYSIDRFSKVFTLANAREKVDELRSYVKKGGDPVGDEKAEKHVPQKMTFKELAKTFKTIKFSEYKDSTKEFYEWLIDVKILPTLGERPVNEITKHEIVKLLNKIAIEGGAKTIANRTRSRLHHMYEFAISQGIVDDNPVSGTKPFEGGENESERYYTEDQIKQIWGTFELLNEPVQSYLKIVTLTGQRRTETHYMKWENIKYEKDNDFEGWVWMIPKELAKSDRDHLVPLNPLALQIINDLKERAGDNPYVFASITKVNIPIALKTIKRAVRKVKKNSGVKDFKLHDLRRTVATYLAKLGTPQEVVSKILNHKTGSGGSVVTRIYNRYEYREERQRALRKWSSELDKILTDEKLKVTEGKIFQISK